MFGGLHILKHTDIHNLPKYDDIKHVNDIDYVYRLILNRRKINMECNELKVSSKSNPNSIAGMIAALIKENEKNISLQCIGAGAVNQAVKAIATARGFIAPNGLNLKCIPAFQRIDIDGIQRTGIKFILEVD